MESGRISHLFIKPGKGAAMKTIPSCLAIEGKGMEHDQSFGSKKRQILIVESETLRDFGLLPGQIRENMVVEKLALSRLPVGTRLSTDEVVLEVSGDCAPCDFLNSIKPGLMDAIRGRRGVFAVVRKGGILKVGSDVAIEAEL
jgi:MOSC domain-containing protein YiiM